MRLFDGSENTSYGRTIGVLVAVIVVVLAFQFTRRTPDEAERERAQVMLRRIYDLEVAHFAEFGTYLPIDREKNGAVLLLNDTPGRFHYRVVVTPDAFVAYAEADLNGNGRPEIWQVDVAHSEPMQIQGD